MIKTSLVVSAVLAIFAVSARPSGATSLLANGDFEQGVAGWTVPDEFDTFLAVGSLVQCGSLAAHFSGIGQPAVHKVFQWVTVGGGRSYEFDGWVLRNDMDVGPIALSITWFDVRGEYVGEVLSPPASDGNPTYQHLDVTPVSAPLPAKSARVAVQVPVTGDFVVHLDDFRFHDVTPPAVPTSAPTAAPTPIPSASPTRTTTSTPRATNSSTPTPLVTHGSSPVPEPTAFPQLVNGGFEQLREDGTAYAWHKQGGSMGVASSPRHEGNHTLVFTSDSTSTKWVHQTVAVQPGAFYEAAVWMQNGPAVQATFLRLSWYDSADGSGSAMGNSDSGLVVGATGYFLPVSTGPVQAPVGALSVKVKLMLRPVSTDPATTYFDDATMSETTPPVAVFEPNGDTTGSGGRRPAAGSIARILPGAEVEETVLQEQATPFRLVNEKEPGRDAELAASPGPGGGSLWPIFLAIGSVVGVLSLLGWYEWRRKAVRDREV